MTDAYFGGKIIGGFILGILAILGATLYFAGVLAVAVARLAWVGGKWAWARR